MGFIINPYVFQVASTFTNTKAVSKSLTTGTSNSISFTDTSDAFNFTGADTWSISFWVKAGWNSSLNTNIHFLLGQKTNASFQMVDMIKIMYNESTNRIEVRYGNKPSSSIQWYNQGGWLFHSNSGIYAAGYAAAGLGTTFWSSSNRGYVNSDNYTMITVTNDGSNTAASLRLYWNANGMGTAPIQTNNNSGNRAENPISSTNDRAWSLGSNGVSQGETKTGNNTATVYNDVTFWDKQLSDSEVTELYNSGTVLDATTHTAADTNLKGYWTFETDGDNTLGDAAGQDFEINGDSAIVNK